MIVVAGASGDLGLRIVRALRAKGAPVRALVREQSKSDAKESLRATGAELVEVSYGAAESLSQACRGGACVVSAVLGLHDTIVGDQTRLLDAAVAASVPRFIPSDYASDFTKLPWGRNRNFDLHNEFRTIADRAKIHVTSILNGAFMDLLHGDAPLILHKIRRVLYWQSAEQKLDFTTRNDTAAFTAAVALDTQTPRFIRVAGDQLSARELAATVSEVSGKHFGLLRAGDLKRLGALINVTRALAPQEDAPFPAWQGMQYMRDMFDGRGLLEPLDNARYPEIKATSVRDYLRSGAKD